jgi:hypothetical protein
MGGISAMLREVRGSSAGNDVFELLFNHSERVLAQMS